MVINTFFQLQFLMNVLVDGGNMQSTITYKNFYKLMKVEGLIIIEDAIQFDKSRTAFIYNFLQMKDSDRKLFLKSIINRPGIVEKLEKLEKSYELEKDIIDWNKVPNRDLEYYLKKYNIERILGEVNNITEDELVTVEKLSKRFGLGIKGDAVNEYASILEGTQESGFRLPIRIYNDFAAEDILNLNLDIENLGDEKGFLICIIDDFLGENPRGDEIIRWMNENDKIHNNAICILLSSRDREQIKLENSKIYIEYVKKGQVQLDENIQSALIKSQYSIMLHMLKIKKIEAINKAYNYGLNNLDVAVHLSAMALEEGTTNYEVLTNWLELREKFSMDKNNIEEAKRIILLSSMLNILVSQEFLPNYDTDDIEEINVFENFDYSVNKYSMPPMTGDIFCLKDNYYLLIGQECDLSIREGKRNTPIAELLPIKKLSRQDLGNFKEKYGYERMVLGSFVDINGEYGNIVIDCTKRVVVDNEILDLCAFNDEGISKMDMNKNLSLEQKCLLPKQWEDYYNNIKENLKTLIKISKAINLCEVKDKFTLEELIQSLGASHGGRLISVVDYKITENILAYEVKRVCRLREHVLLANKLYLEYRGRQAFNTINMDIAKPFKYVLSIDGINGQAEDLVGTVILTNKRTENVEDKYKNRTWIISKKDIIGFLTCDQTLFDRYKTELDSEDDSIVLMDRVGKLQSKSIYYTKLSKNNINTLKLKL